jgi:opacity protein-like surface antigen
MRSLACRLAVRALLLASCLLVAAPVAAQGFGIGARMAWVKSDVDIDDDSVRFTGGQIRLGLSQRLGVEVSLDRHSETFELLNEKVTETPVQVSLLMRLAGGSLSPYLLGGPGWYTRKVELVDGPGDGISTREFGWHAGGGLEIRLGKHAGVHGDYRYTFLDFDGDDDEEEEDEGGFVSRLLPGYKGSMITVGFSVYF